MITTSFILNAISGVAALITFIIFSFGIYFFYRLGQKAKAYLFNRPELSSAVMITGPISVMFLMVGHIFHFISDFFQIELILLSDAITTIGFISLFVCSIYFFKLFKPVRDKLKEIN